MFDSCQSSFLVQSALLGWFGGLASLNVYGNKALWYYEGPTQVWRDTGWGLKSKRDAGFKGN